MDTHKLEPCKDNMIGGGSWIGAVTSCTDDCVHAVPIMFEVAGRELWMLKINPVVKTAELVGEDIRKYMTENEFAFAHR